MRQISASHFIHITNTNSLSVEKYSSTIDFSNIIINFKKFTESCQSYCSNYNRKYSCPPYSPSFTSFAAIVKEVSVICYCLSLNQYTPLPIYSRIRAANAILKSLIDKELLSYKQKGFLVAGSGSCRACKPCGAKIGVPCKKSERRIYSLEAMGVDVGALVKECFGFELQWYIKGKEPPEYTCVVGAVLL